MTLKVNFLLLQNGQVTVKWDSLLARGLAHTLWSQQQVAFNANCGKNRKHIGHSCVLAIRLQSGLGRKTHRKCSTASCCHTLLYNPVGRVKCSSGSSLLLKRITHRYFGTLMIKSVRPGRKAGPQSVPAPFICGSVTPAVVRPTDE